MADTGAEPHVEASSEPRLAKTETELATNPLHGDGEKEESAKESSAGGPVSQLGCGIFDGIVRLGEAHLLTITDFDRTGNKRCFYRRFDCYNSCVWRR